LNEREIEVKRCIVFRDVHNQLPYKEETIVVNRAYEKADDIIYDSYSKVGFKEESLQLYAIGFMVRRLSLDLTAHKAFSSPKTLQMMSNVYMFKSMRECTSILKLLDPHTFKEKKTLDEFDNFRLGDVLEMI
jgi:hypothetical protein